MPEIITDATLLAMGYERRGNGVCRGADCHRPIIWYFNPNKRWEPFEYDLQSREPFATRQLTPHYATCPTAKAAARKRLAQCSLFGKEVA